MTHTLEEIEKIQRLVEFRTERRYGWPNDYVGREITFALLEKCDYEALLTALRSAEQALAEAKAEKWISVKERLPEEYGQALVIDNSNGNPCVAFHLVRGWFRDNEDRAVVVTHWMPIPTPPKGDNA